MKKDSTIASRYEQAGAYSVGALREVSNWLCAPEHCQQRIPLLKSNLPALHAIYGPPCQTYRGSACLFEVWRIEHEGLVIWLLSAEGKGSCFEAEHSTPPWKGWPPADIQKILSFFEAHLAKLTAVR